MNNYNSLTNTHSLKKYSLLILFVIVTLIPISLVYAATGDFIASITDADGAGGAFGAPISTAVDSNNRIIVPDAPNNRVQIFNSAGVFQASITDADGAGCTFTTYPKTDHFVNYL